MVLLCPLSITVVNVTGGVAPVAGVTEMAWVANGSPWKSELKMRLCGDTWICGVPVVKVTWKGEEVWPPRLSVTPILNENGPVWVGVPLRSPLGLMVSPGGLLFMENMYGGTPPVAAICWE